MNVYRLKEGLLTALYPRRCLLCGEVVAIDETLCEKCCHAHKISRKACRYCGREPEACVCHHAAQVYDGFAAPYYFESSLANGVYRLKNAGFSELATPMGKAVAQAFRERFYQAEIDCVCFVPLTKKKEKQRGYNQAELLAAAVAEALNVPCVALLEKVRETKSQRKSSITERRKNLQGAFAASEKAAQQHILLVDDVKTTGSTLNACAAVLKKNGAAAVYAAAFTVTKRK